jgi:ferrochelatase
MTPGKFDAVLLIAFGGPTCRQEIRPFLEQVARGRKISAERLEAVALHYEQMGGRSPLNELTFRQAHALRYRLAAEGVDLPVEVGMRNWHPFIVETLAAMQERGVRRALGIILSAQDSEAGWQRYVADVEAARSLLVERSGSAPEIAIAPNWHDEPLFIDAVACRVAQALAQVPAERRNVTPLVFTAHSIPAAMATGSPYVEQLERGCRLVVERLGHPGWQLAYQSRSGRPEDPWLEPDINQVIAGLDRTTAREVVVAPIGFVCDHVEVLYDLDVAARATARARGLQLVRAATVNDHAAFIAMLASLTKRACGVEGT